MPTPTPTPKGTRMLGVAFPLLLIVFYYQLGTTSFLGFAFIGLTAPPHPG